MLELLELASEIVNVRLNVLPGLLRFLEDLLAVLVRTGSKKDSVASKTPRACKSIGLHDLKREADVRIGIHVRERRSEIAIHMDAGRALRNNLLCSALALIKIRDEFAQRGRERNSKQDTQEAG